MTARLAFTAALGVAFGAALLAAGPVRADTVPDTLKARLVRPDSGGWSFLGMAMDPASGAYASKAGYGFNGNDVQLFDNIGAFRAGRSSSTVTLGGDNTAGTYFTIGNGALTARTYTPTGEWDWPAGNRIGSWDLASGALSATNDALPGITGRNGYDTFDWGGFSGVNLLQDQTGRYVMGTDGSGTWTIHQLSADLSVAASRSFAAGTLGYAFVRDGVFYLGDSYWRPHIGASFDFATGTLAAADIRITGLGDSAYLSNTLYDPGSDSLFLYNSNTASIYEVRNVTTGGTVPEPASWALLITGFGAVGLAARQRRRQPQAVAA